MEQTKNGHGISFKKMRGILDCFTNVSHKKRKGIWKIHNIRDVWSEAISSKKSHTHQKPIGLQQELINAVSNEGDVIVDPAAGSFSVMESAINANRLFLGADING